MTTNTLNTSSLWKKQRSCKKPSYNLKAVKRSLKQESRYNWDLEE